MPSRGVFRLALSHDQGECREGGWSSAGSAEITEVHTRRDFGRQFCGKTDIRRLRNSRRGLSQVDLATGKKTENASAISGLSALVYGSMELSVRCEQFANQKGERQEPSQTATNSNKPVGNQA